MSGRKVWYARAGARLPEVPARAGSSGQKGKAVGGSGGSGRQRARRACYIHGSVPTHEKATCSHLILLSLNIPLSNGSRLSAMCSSSSVGVVAEEVCVGCVWQVGVHPWVVVWYRRQQLMNKWVPSARGRMMRTCEGSV